VAIDNMPDFRAFLTTEEVLGYLKITPRTIYRLIRCGELPAVRIGRQWRFRRSDLDGWLERQRTFSVASVVIEPRRRQQADGYLDGKPVPTSAERKVSMESES
jgi:excisionase family DNA binding protein